MTIDVTMKTKSDAKLFQALYKQLKKHLDAISKERDALRRLRNEIEDVLEPTNRGVEALEEAVYAFSEQL